MVCASLSWKLLGTSGPALHVRVSRSRNSVVAEETRSQPPMTRTRFEPTLAQVWWYLESQIRWFCKKNIMLWMTVLTR